jgi:hypothetical protein
MTDIAPLDTMGAHFDTGSKFFRVMAKMGTTLPHLQKPIDSATARRNLAAYLAAGCPKLPTELIGPFPEPIIGRNEHGHVFITFTALDRSGAEEIAALLSEEYRVSDYGKQLFTSTNDDGYDACHRLVQGQRYTVALVPHTEIKKDSERTTQGLRDHAQTKYGYQKPLGGIVPHIRRIVSDEQMAEWNLWYIAALHDTIKDAGGDPFVLCANRSGDGRWVLADWDEPGRRWSTEGASAFLVPAT